MASDWQSKGAPLFNPPDTIGEMPFDVEIEGQ